MNYRITLAYDGTDYCGWQLQLAQPTIQGVLGAALARLERAPVVTHAAGRTDAGVHAEGQVVSFRLAREWRGDVLRQALNAHLPPDIRVLEAMPAAADFHARRAARSKTYRYQICPAEVLSPFVARYAWHHPYQLDLAGLSAAGRELIGTHDFTAFTVAACEAKTRVRTLTDFQIDAADTLLRLSFTGDGFLRYQVRTMIGALVELNRGRLKAASMAELLARRERALVGAPAPAKGLTLVKVEY